jgi:predicted RNA binding protein YcfA (HicA-like mRNA interferase family)
MATGDIQGRLPRWSAREWINWLKELGYQRKVQRHGSGHIQMENPETGRKIAVPAPRRKGDVIDPWVASRIMKAALGS